jgi:hypothetical protein
VTPAYSRRFGLRRKVMPYLARGMTQYFETKENGKRTIECRDEGSTIIPVLLDGPSRPFMHTKSSPYFRTRLRRLTAPGVSSLLFEVYSRSARIQLISPCFARLEFVS